MRIVLDMDEVITDTLTPWIKQYNEDWNDKLTISQITEWNLHTAVKPECGHKIYNYLNNEGFFYNLKPLPGAVDGFNKLLESGHDVVVATAVPRGSKFSYNEKLEWFSKHIPQWDQKGFMSVHKKDWLRGDIMFDDGHHNLRGFCGVAVCFDKPWNQQSNFDYSISDYRVKNWEQFLETIEVIKETHPVLVRLAIDERLHKLEIPKNEWLYE